MASISTAAPQFLVSKLSDPLVFYEERPWGRREFYVEDPDGYILCFSEAV
jgi:hypothetical protein